MIGSTQHQPSVFYAALGRQAALIRDPEIDQLSRILDDEELVNLTRLALKRRRPRSATTGRRSIAPDRLLRAAVLKDRKGWSLRQLERELRGSLLYRDFTRFDSDPIPTAATFSRNLALLDDSILHQVNERVVRKAIQERVTAGRRLRTDTTVTESNIHHPTDSTLLSDGVRVLTRGLRKLSELCAPGAIKIVDHASSTKKQVITIHHAAKAFTDGAKEDLVTGYKKLVGITRGVLRRASAAVKDLNSGAIAVAAGAELKAKAIVAQIQHYEPLVKQVVAQTKARVFRGDTHFPGKILSLFEPHSQVIRKGKAHKPAEFGRLVRIDEVDNGIVSNYEVLEGNRADQESWEPALHQHKATFGRPPHMATADRGFFSAENVRQAKALGVKKVALAARGRLSQAQMKIQKQRWFRKAQGWRAGIEGRIGTLKHRFGMARAAFKHESGFKRSVGWAVITNNLISVVRVRRMREAASDGT